LTTSIARVGDVIGVKAQATNNFSVFIFEFRVAVFQARIGGATAVASIPVTATVIVFVVAVPVTLPLGIFTWFLACFRRWSYKRWILAFAFFAPLVGVFNSTTITFVPPTFAAIVVVVAECVAPPRGMAALGGVRSCALPATNTALIYLRNAFAGTVVKLFREFAQCWQVSLGRRVIVACRFVFATLRRGG